MPLKKLSQNTVFIPVYENILSKFKIHVRRGYTQLKENEYYENIKCRKFIILYRITEVIFFVIRTLSFLMHAFSYF